MGRPRGRRFCGSVAERFWAKVDKSGPVMPGMTTPCWEWTGSRNRKGYGTFTPRTSGPGRGSTLAHRFGWILVHGPVPEGREVCHRCHNRGCVNMVEHLYAGTHQENVAEAQQLGHYAKLNPVRGDARFNTRIPDSDIEQVRLLHALRAAPASVLAAIFGTTKKHVGSIVEMRKRAHLGPPLLLDLPRRKTA